MRQTSYYNGMKTVMLINMVMTLPEWSGENRGAERVENKNGTCDPVESVRNCEKLLKASKKAIKWTMNSNVVLPN